MEGEKINILLNTGEKVCKIFTPFQVETGEFSGFPDKKRARVFFLGFKNKGRISEVFSQLESELVRMNFEKEKREFHPHITLARIKKYDILPSLSPLNISFIIEGFSLYESILRKEGPLYKILKFFSFRRI